MNRANPDLLEQLGGELALRRIISDLVDRMTSDLMIGFLFAKVDRQRLKELEFQHAARHFGADVAYEGRSLRQVHAPHRIQGGQFDRRLHILRQVLQQHKVAAEVQRAWLDHQESLRHKIVSTGGESCW